MASNLDVLAPKNIEKQILIKICNENTAGMYSNIGFQGKVFIEHYTGTRGQNINGHSTKTKANEVIFSNIFSMVAF